MKILVTTTLLIATMLCHAQAGSEIYLFDLNTRDGMMRLTGGINFTAHKGYDNQPFFHPSKPVIYFSSFDDSGRSDIKYFDYKKKTTVALTHSHEREYSPTVTPDGKYISCILQRDNGAQDLVKYPISGGKPQVMIDKLVIGYHAWIDNDRLILFVLDDSIQNTLRLYNKVSRKDSVLAVNIGRSLHHIPGTSAMSFIQKTSDSTSVICKYDWIINQVQVITATAGNSDHICWLDANTVFSTSGNSVYYLRLTGEMGWTPVTIENKELRLAGLSRVAIDAKAGKLALVVAE